MCQLNLVHDFHNKRRGRETETVTYAQQVCNSTSSQQGPLYILAGEGGGGEVGLVTFSSDDPHFQPWLVRVEGRAVKMATGAGVLVE